MRLPLSVDHGAHFIARVLSAYPAHVRAGTDSLRRGRPTDAAMADTDGHARRPSSSLERFRQKRASSSSSSIIPSKKNSENEPTVANGGFIAATPTIAPRAQPRATPGSSAARPSTGDKLAALKARRSAARPASGRRGPAEESKAKSSSEDVPSKALFASGRWDELGGTKDSADDNSKRAEDTGPPGAKTRGTSAVRVSNEWREFDPRGSFGRPGSTSTQKEVPSSSTTSAPRVDNNDAAASRTHHQPRPPARDATEHIEPPEAAQTPSQPVASRRRQSHSPGHQSMKNQPPVLVPAVVALHIQNEPDLKLNDVCLTVHDSSKDGGIEATLARPKTTLKKTYAAHVQCANAGECANGTGFLDAVAASVTDGTSCAMVTTGIHASGKSTLTRGGDEGGTKGCGVCGTVAGAVFGAVESLQRKCDDLVSVSVSAVADVITAPVDSTIPVARRKTHEVLVDALALGIELAQRTNEGGDVTAETSLRGGRGSGAASVGASFHGAGSDTRVNIREHPTRGFYADGCVEIVADDADDCARLIELACDGFRAQEQKLRLTGRIKSPTSDDFGGERCHCALQVRIIRRSKSGRLDKVTGVFLPEKETTSEVHVVDLAGVDRHGGKGAAEDAALKAVTRVVDALADAKSHVPYRDSKLTRLIHKSLGNAGKLFATVCVSKSTARYEETNAMLQFAQKIARGVRGRVIAHTVAYAAECARLDEAAAVLADALGLSLSGLASGDVQLDMESGDDLLKLRDALAEGERLRAEAGELGERATRSRRVRELFL